MNIKLFFMIEIEDRLKAEFSEDEDISEIGRMAIEIVRCDDLLISVALMRHAVTSGLLSADSEEVGENLMFIIFHTPFPSVMLAALSRLVGLEFDVAKKQEWLKSLQIFLDDVILAQQDDGRAFQALLGDNLPN